MQSPGLPTENQREEPGCLPHVTGKPQVLERRFGYKDITSAASSEAASDQAEAWWCRMTLAEALSTGWLNPPVAARSAWSSKSPPEELLAPLWTSPKVHSAT